MTTAADWRSRVGDIWADEWRRTDRSFANLSCHLDAAIRALAPDAGEALDIGCGAGTTGLALAGAKPRLCVTGIDLSAAMIAVAADRARTAGLAARARFEARSVSDLSRDRRYDLLVSRHGLMFFADPVASLAHLRSLARPGAPLVFSCFDTRSTNRFATLADDLLGRRPPTSDGPGPFAFADMDRVAALLAASGWDGASAARVPFAYRAGLGSDPVADAIGFLSRIGPVAGTLRDAGPNDRAAMMLELARLLAHYRRGDAVDLPASAWVWRARAGEP